MANGLPRALHSAGHPTHLAVPAYPEILDGLQRCHPVAELKLPRGEVRVFSGLMPDSDVPVLAIDH
ncbi:MAG: glycogen/starch synthase, partial [Granulosicoccaceae bacterium]